jgi:hypothetical protein
MKRSVNMAIKKVLLIGGCLLVNMLIVRCATQLAGVETTNGCTVVATATDIEGTAPPLSRVFIFDSSYIPYIDSGVGIGTAVDDKGVFQFNTPTGGAYNIFIIGPTGEAASIAIKSPDSTDAGSVVKKQELQYPGAISGTISSAASDTFLIFLSGMCHYQLVPVARAFYLANIPEGVYSLKVARLSGPHRDPAMKILYEQVVQVYRGETAPIGQIGF